MMHQLYRVISVEKAGAYVLRIRFNDGSMQTIDFEPVLAGEIFGPLRDPLLFAEVRVDPEVHTIVWPGGADFDPETLHDWPKHADAFKAAAQRWKAAMLTR